ncbi:MAG: integrase core domain protein [Deltaproteobacteria bacterium]|nr:integrase core domain protein [Deltaproteobacteria bacterium]
MAREDMIMMSKKELQRLHVIEKVVEGCIRQTEAAGILSLSDRHIRRIVRRIRQEGHQGIVHKSRGKPSNHRVAETFRETVIRLYRTQYPDFGPTLASEKLRERDGIAVNDETLRLWLIHSGDWKKARKKRKHHAWRERKSHYGQMLQMDGSHHDWFERRAPTCVLMSYIDDATGRAFARFYGYEGTLPALDSLKRYIKRHGLPLSIYLDKHSTYRSIGKPTIENELNGTKPLSQFERALTELGIQVIHANSPQAKGRIERLFRTFQDRLVKEMRLRDISSLEEGNAFLKTYLPVYNRRFSVQPQQPPDLHRMLPQGTDTTMIFCIRTERSLRNDRTIAHHKKLYQIEENLRARTVTVSELLDGSLVITHNGKRLAYHELAQRPVHKKQVQEKDPQRPGRAYGPAPADHPWRRFRIAFPNRKKEEALESPLRI